VNVSLLEFSIVQSYSLGLHQQNNVSIPHRIGLCSVLRPRQHSIGYMGDGFYRSKDPINSIKVLKEMLQRRKQRTKTTKYTYAQTNNIHKKGFYSPTHDPLSANDSSA